MAQPLDLQRTAKPEETPTPVTAPPAHTPKPFLAAFNAVPSITPQAFKADGKWHLVYELHISNFDKWDYRFTHIEVVAGDAAQKTLGGFGRILEPLPVGEFRPAGRCAGNNRAPHQRKNRRLPG